MFLKVLLLLTLSYFGFLALAHITVPVPSKLYKDVETFSSDSTVELTHPEINDIFSQVNQLDVKDFDMYPNHTLDTQEHIIDGDIHYYNRNRDETEVAFVKRCLERARQNKHIMGMVVDMSSHANFNCVYKKRKPHPSQSTAAHERPIRVQETNKEDNVILFLRSDIRRTIHKHNHHSTTTIPSTNKEVIVEVDSATSANGFELDQPTQYKETDPPVDILDNYGHYHTSSTVWSTLQPDTPKCLDVKCDDGTSDCPVQLSNTYATPKTNSRIGSILPSFTYTECR